MKRGYGSENDLEHTEDGACGADPGAVSERATLGLDQVGTLKPATFRRSGRRRDLRP